jgi:hypothetical protein
MALRFAVRRFKPGGIFYQVLFFEKNIGNGWFAIAAVREGFYITIVFSPSGKPYRAAVFYVSINCGIGQAYLK